MRAMSFGLHNSAHGLPCDHTMGQKRNLSAAAGEMSASSLTRQAFSHGFVSRRLQSQAPSSPLQQVAAQRNVVSLAMTAAEGTTRSATVEPHSTFSASRGIRFRPCIDIHKGKVKQIVGSTLRDLPEASSASAEGSEASSSSEPVTNFESEKAAAEYAELYRNDGLMGGHVIMLGADEASQSAAREALQAFPGGFHIGGGINPDNAKGYLDAGASHVIVTSYVFRDGQVDQQRLKNLVDVVGSKRLVLDLSCRKKDGAYYVVTDRWQRFSDLALSPESLARLAESADEFLVHGVDVEGMKLGIDEELVEVLGKWSPIPVTYAGGARTIEDLERVKAAGQGRVDITVGSALDIFGGSLKYPDVVSWHKEQQR